MMIARSRHRARAGTRLALVLSLAILLAGCTGEDAPDADASAGGPVEVRRSHDAFVVQDLNLTAEGFPDEHKPYFEGANFTVAFTVTNGGGTASSEFVTLVIGGDVVLAERMRLDPGESYAYAHAWVPDAAGKVRIDAKAGSYVQSLDVDVKPRLRVGDRATGELANATLLRVYSDTPGYTTLRLSLTTRDAAHSSEAVAGAVARLVCRSLNGGDPAFAAEATPLRLPEEDGGTMQDHVRVRQCPQGTEAVAAQVVAWDRVADTPATTLSWLLR